MNKYAASFLGRTKDAIGRRYLINTVVEGTDTDNARLNLYNNYQDISCLTLRKL